MLFSFRLSFLLVAFFLFGFSNRAATREAADDVVTYAAALEQLARWCDDHDLAAEAEATRAAMLPQAADQIFIPTLPLRAGRADDTGFPPSEPAASASNRTVWHYRLVTLRYESAEKLFAEAQALAEAGKGGDAVERLIAVLHADPDHLAARTFFGFQRHDGCWRTGWEIAQLLQGYVDHPRFGWMKKEHVPRYEQGERFWVDPARKRAAGEWITAAEEQRRRADIRYGWDIQSEHYQLRTNAGLEEGVQMIRRLENLYRGWKLLFFRFFATDAQLARLFKTLEPGKPAEMKLARHSVYVYRSKADYVANLREVEPQIEITSGFYYPPQSRCYFFPPDPRTMDEQECRHIENTLLHEATHQLFQESVSLKVMPGQKCNFWIFEGIAMYMETFRQEGDYYVVGDADCDWLVAARYRFRTSRFYMPLEQLTRMGQRDFQGFGSHLRTGSEPDEKLRMLYSQSAGLAHFLMHGENGRFRDMTVQYLRRLYNRDDRPDTLSKLTGLSYRELDALYAAFIQKTTNDVPASAESIPR